MELDDAINVVLTIVCGWCLIQLIDLLLQIGY